MILLWEDALVENDQKANACADRRVSDVEHRIKESEMPAFKHGKPVASNHWQPIRKIEPDRGYPIGQHGVYNRKVEHVNDLTVKEIFITSFRRKESGNFVVAVTEKDAVENRIDYIAQGSGKNQRYGNDQQFMGLVLNGVVQPVTDPGYGHESEQRQKQFA